MQLSGFNLAVKWSKGEPCGEKAMTEFQELERNFKELEYAPAPYNEGDFVHNHLDLRG